jgi:hypothetical protein
MKRSAVINLLVIGGIFLVLVVLQVLLYSNEEAPNENEENGDRSTYCSRTYGTRGLYLYLEESGYDVSRLRKQYTTLESEGITTLFVVVPLPFLQPSAEEFKALTDWVEKGGQLVIVDRIVANVEFGPDLKINSRLRSQAKNDSLRILQPSTFTSGVSTPEFYDYTSTLRIAGGPSVGYIGDSTGPSLASVPYGKGRVVLLTDPYIIANNGIMQGDNLKLALNLINEVAPNKKLAFDEYHHGYDAKFQVGGMLGYFQGTPVLWMLAQFGLLTLVVVYSRGRRFARALPLKEEDRASSLEFVGSMAHLQSLASASDLAIENIYGRFRQRLCRYAGMPTNVTTRQLAEAAGRRGRIPEGILHKTLVRCEEILTGSAVSDDELLGITSRIRQWQNDLKL